MKTARPTTKAKAKTPARRAAKRMVLPKPAPPSYHPGPLIDCPEHLAAALAALRAGDPHIIPMMLEICGDIPLRRAEPGFEGLASIIISQQVSVASANAITARLQAGVSPLTPAGLLAATETVLKGCGLSSPKIRALRALAGAIINGLELAELGRHDAELAHELLVAVKGIGPWTADIFLMFCLGHPDAWPAGDLALQEAARLALKLEKRPDARGLEAIGERWRPHRAVAARVLWAYYRVAKSGREGIAVAAG